MPHCPACGQPLQVATSRCRICGLTLTGSAAAGLWQVDQQMAQLAVRRVALIDQLRSGATSAGPSLASAPPPLPLPPRWTSSSVASSGCNTLPAPSRRNHVPRYAGESPGPPP